jgi:transposase InsO family protein
MPDPELALWRFSLIAPLLHRAPNVSLTEMARQLAAEVRHGPDGTPTVVSAETLLRWLRRYQQGDLEALDNQPRSDRGRCRALDPDTVDQLLVLADQHPDWTVKALHRQLERDRGQSLPLKPMYRLLKGRQRAKPTDAFRRRPTGVPQILWLADTMHGPAVYGPRRKKSTCFLLVVFDDASRAVMGSAFARRDNVAALMPVLRDAVLARGLPHRLLVDNGANYRSRVLRTACAQLGVHLVYATAYRPTSKARLERFFLTVRRQMLPRLSAAPSLQQVQTEWARFVAQYHETPHRSLTQLMGAPTTPLSFYLRFLPDDVRYPPELDLADLFLVEATRRVNADATIRVASRYWEVDPQLVGQRLLIRFNPDHQSTSSLPVRVLYRPLEDTQAAFLHAFPVP